MGISCVKITCLKLNRVVDVWNSVKCRNYSRNFNVFFSYFVDFRCISFPLWKGGVCCEKQHLERKKHYTKNKGFSRIYPCLYRYSFSYNTVSVHRSYTFIIALRYRRERYFLPFKPVAFHACAAVSFFCHAFPDTRSLSHAAWLPTSFSPSPYFSYIVESRDVTYSPPGLSCFFWTRLYVNVSSIFSESHLNLVNPLLLVLPFASESMEQFTPYDNKSWIMWPSRLLYRERLRLITLHCLIRSFFLNKWLRNIVRSNPYFLNYSLRKTLRYNPHFFKC
jgi:hypothetical protein